MSDAERIAPSDGLEAAGWQEVARAAATRLGKHEAEEAAGFLRELLIFGLEGSDYAIPVERIREIVRMRSLTPVPRAPDWLLGVIALRGEIVEVIDLRKRLSLVASPPDRSSRVIVLHGDGERVTGVLVDSVREVVRLADAAANPGHGIESPAVIEIFERDGRFVSILDVDRVLELRDE
jgi:purine-binding chemotaxis protein CheW